MQDKSRSPSTARVAPLVQESDAMAMERDFIAILNMENKAMTEVQRSEAGLVMIRMS